MKLDLFLLVVGITFPLVSACTPDQINSAIEACKGDPSCYEIIDEAIEEELAARGITGGKMTNVEFNDVSSFAKRYVWKNESILQQSKTQELFNEKRSLHNITGANEYSLLNQETTNAMLAFFQDNDYKRAHDFLDLENIFIEEKQLLIENGIKYLIYKSGYQTFKYEVYIEQIFTFTIDLSIQNIYWGERKLINELDQKIIDFLDLEYSVSSEIDRSSYIEKSKAIWKTADSLYFYGRLTQDFVDNKIERFNITMGYFSKNNSDWLFIHFYYVFSPSFSSFLSLFDRKVGDMFGTPLHNILPEFEIEIVELVNFIGSIDPSLINYDSVEGGLIFGDVKYLFVSSFANFPFNDLLI